MRIFYLNPLYVEVGFWSAAILATVYCETIRRSGWKFISFRWHRILSAIFSIYVVGLGLMLYITTTAPPSYDLDRLFKHKVFTLLVAFIGLILLFGSIVSEKSQVEKAFGVAKKDTDSLSSQLKNDLDDESEF